MLLKKNNKGILNEGSADFKNSIFKDNTSGFGGVVKNRGKLTLNDCEFTNNTAVYGGSVANAGEMMVNNCVFKDCKSRFAPAIHNSGDMLKINNSCFKHNHGDIIVGAVYNSQSQAFIKNCHFKNNCTDSDMNPSSLYSSANLCVLGCVFEGNGSDLKTTTSNTILINCGDVGVDGQYDKFNNCNNQIYLNKLIKIFPKSFDLKSDIFIDDETEITDNNLIIDGNNHHIIPFDDECVIKINAENIVFKNIKFENIVKFDNNGEITFKECEFSCFNKEIFNNSFRLTFKDCIFFNDYQIVNSGEVILIKNDAMEVFHDGEIELINTKFDLLNF